MHELGGLVSGLRRSSTKFRLPLLAGLAAAGLLAPAVVCAAPASAAPAPVISPAPTDPAAPATEAPAPAPSASPAPTGTPQVTLAPPESPSPGSTGVANAQLMNPSVVPKMDKIKIERGVGGATLGQGLERIKQRRSTQDNVDNKTNERLQTSSEVSTQSLTRVLPSLVPAAWMAPGVQGLDVSGWQSSVNWSTQWSMGARFAYVKATEGVDFQSSGYSSQYSGSANAGFIRGAYHFALPSQSTAVTQADYFVNHGGGWSADGKTLPPLLDIEYNPYSELGNTCYNMSSSAMVGWIRDFSNRVLYRTGRLPMIYTTTDWWSKCTGNSAAFGNQPLHIAAYSQVLGALPMSWSTYSVWQYSSTGPFAGDSNAWNGTYANLQKFATTADGTAPEAAISNTADVVAADANGALWDYSANGTGGFSGRKQIGSGWVNLRSINVIDWNADGILDIVAQWTSGKVSVYLGNTSAGFSAGPVLASSGFGGYQLTISYPLSSSPYPQIIGRNDAGTLVLWKNTSGAGLSAPQQIGSGWSGKNLFMIDFDGDGNQDILAQDASGALVLYRMNGAGGFMAENRPTVGNGWNGLTSVTVGTGFVGTGSVGLMGRTKDGNYYYYAVPGNSTIGSARAVGNGWNGFLIAGGENINMSAAPAPSPSPSPSPSPTPTPSPSPTPSTTAPVTPAGGLLPAGDFNGDGKPDLIGKKADGTIWLSPGTGGGSFGTPVKIGSGWGIYSHLIGGIDLNADGKPDLLAVQPDGTVWFYAGTGAVNSSSEGYQTRVQLASGWGQYTEIVSAGDLNGDGTDDVVAYGADGALWFYAGTGSVSGADSGLRPAVKIGTSGWNVYTNLLGMHDYNGDGKDDLVGTRSDGSLWLYAGTGTSSATDNGYKPAARLAASGWSGFSDVVAPGDLDGDHKDDLLARKSDGTLSFFSGTGMSNEGYLPAQQVGTSGWNAFSKVISVGDMNGDKRPDLFAVRTDGTLWFYAGTGDGHYAPAVRIGSGWNIYKDIVGVSDFDGDGKNDLLAARPDGTLWFYAGTGSIGGSNEGYAPARKVGTGWNVYSRLVGTGDLNGDGKNDLVAVRTDGSLWYYAGTGSVSGTSEGYSPGIKIGRSGWSIFTSVVGVRDYNGDGKNDLLAARSDGTLWFYAGSNTASLAPGVKVGNSGWTAYSAILGTGDSNGDGKNDFLGVNVSGSLWYYAGTQMTDDGYSAAVTRGLLP